MLERSIISCAVTGGGETQHINPAVPVTPAAIAQEATAAAAAGAAIVHIHVRDPATGSGSMSVALYRETVERIRDSGTDVIINLTTGPGARFIPGRDDPGHAAPGSTLSSPDARVEHVLELKPEMCSLDIATLNYGANTMINVPAHLARMAELVQKAGVKPELEVFELGHIRLACDMIEKGQITGAPLFQICLGIPWGAPADVETMLRMRDTLPPGSTWAAFGISRMQFPSVAAATILGGHVRVGLEDNLYLSRGQLAEGNAVLVRRAVTIIESIGGTIASPAEARRLLGLRISD